MDLATLACHRDGQKKSNWESWAEFVESYLPFGDLRTCLLQAACPFPVSPVPHLHFGLGLCQCSLSARPARPPCDGSVNLHWAGWAGFISGMEGTSSAPSSSANVGPHRSSGAGAQTLYGAIHQPGCPMSVDDLFPFPCLSHKHWEAVTIVLDGYVLSL